MNCCTTKDTTIKICDDRRLVVTSSLAFYVITFEPIEVQTRSASQNDCMNLSFVKDVDGRKLARNGRKTAIREGGSRWLLHNGDHCISLLMNLCVQLRHKYVVFELTCISGHEHIFTAAH